MLLFKTGRQSDHRQIVCQKLIKSKGTGHVFYKVITAFGADWP